MNIFIKKSFYNELIMKSNSSKDDKLDYFKKKLLAILDEKEKAESKVSKSLIFYDSIAKSGKGLPPGTKKEWPAGSGKWYVKNGQGEWIRTYNGNGRGSDKGMQMSIARMRKAIENAKSVDELLAIVERNKLKFTDDDNKTLPIVKELMDHVHTRKVAIKGTKKEEDPEQESNLSENEQDKRIGKASLWDQKLKDAIKTGVVDKIKEAIETIRQEYDVLSKKTKTKSEKEFLDYELKYRERDAKKAIEDLKNPKTTDVNQENVQKIVDTMSTIEIKRELADAERSFRFSGGTDKESQKRIEELNTALNLAAKKQNNKEEKKLNVFENKDYVRMVKELKGEVYEDWNTDPNVFAAYWNRENGKSTGLAISQQVMDIINSHNEPSVLEWQDNIANEIHEKFPKVDKHYVSQHIRQLRMGYRNGKKEKVMVIQNEESESEKHQNRSDAMMGNDNAYKGGSKEEVKEEKVKYPEETEKNIEKEVKKTITLQDIKDNYSRATSVLGSPKTYRLPNGEKIKCHYKLVEAETPTASHDAMTFQKTEGFPTDDSGSTVNDRDYAHDKDAQESVRNIAANYSGLAIQDPPIVTKDGIVVSGNNRTMSSKIAAVKGTDKEYLKDLKEEIEDYGIDAKELSKFSHPRLILEIDEEHKGDYTTEEFAKFNQDGKKSMNATEKAVKISKTIHPEVVQNISGTLAEYDTMAEMWQDKKAAQKVMNALVDGGVIGQNDVSQYFTADSGISEAGKEFIETVMIGSVMNESNIRSLSGDGGKAIRQKLVRGIIPLIDNKGLGNEYSFNGELNKAVDIAIQVTKHRDQFPSVKDYLDQGNMFESSVDLITGKLAELIEGSNQKDFAEKMKSLNAGLRPAANGEFDIFLGRCETKEEVMNNLLNIKATVQKAINNFLKLFS